MQALFPSFPLAYMCVEIVVVDGKATSPLNVRSMNSFIGCLSTLFKCAKACQYLDFSLTWRRSNESSYGCILSSDERLCAVYSILSRIRTVLW